MGLPNLQHLGLLSNMFLSWILMTLYFSSCRVALVSYSLHFERFTSFNKLYGNIFDNIFDSSCFVLLSSLSNSYIESEIEVSSVHHTFSIFLIFSVSNTG